VRRSRIRLWSLPSRVKAEMGKKRTGAPTVTGWVWIGRKGDFSEL
jgi:hypothetical protein